MPSWCAWPLAVMTSSFPVPMACGHWPRLPRSASASSRPRRRAARSAPLPGRAGPQLSGLGAGGCPGVAGYTGLRRLAALMNSGSQVGSQGGQAPGDARPRPATETAGEPRTGPRQATPGGGRSVYGMQELVGLCDYRTTSTGLSARWMTLCAVLPTSSPLRSPRPREPITMTPASCALASPMISRAA